jgi:crotonobetainyl-CoA:carnitine CoA-transferase CaiB-like acyl-CoA transferase
MIVADKTCALTAANAITAALLARERTGRGQFVEIPMLETMVSFLLIEHLSGHTFVPPLGPLGYSRVLAPWRRPYKTKDGHICMLAYTDAQWRKFWTAVGRPQLSEDARFDTFASRSHNIAELYQVAGECLTDRTTDAWLAIFQDLEIPTARVSSLEDLLNDRHLTQVGFFKQARHPSEGEIVVPDFPVRFADTPPEIERLQPRLGEHGHEILTEAGLSDQEIQALRACGATR